MRLVAACVAVALLTACSAVQPWQRGTLAKPQMALDSNPRRSAFVAHVRSAREAASGTVSKDGGGCGCD